MIRLTIPGKPVTQNDVRRMGHWSQARNAKRRVAADVTFVALRDYGLKTPRLVFPVTVVVEDHCRTANLRDESACAPSVKYAMDALVGLGWLPDDGPEFVAGTTYLAPVKTGTDEIVITITSAGIDGEAAVASLEGLNPSEMTYHPRTTHPLPQTANQRKARK